MSILCSAADTVNSSRWFIMLNVSMLTMFLHLSKFGLGSVADFFNTRAKASILAKYAPC